MIEDLSLQYAEVADAKWVSREQLSEMVGKGEVVPYFFIDRIFDLKNIKGAILK